MTAETAATGRSPVYLGREERLGDLTLLSSGKVRDIYALDDDRLVFVTSDRVSAFDVVMNQGVRDKGRVLTAIAAWWFARTGDIVANHLLSTDVAGIPGLSAEERERLRGRVMIVRRCQPTTVEWVVRGYITGSGWKEYKQRGRVCGIPLPEGLEHCQAFDEPLFTPTTKDEDKDRPISPDEARERVGDALYEQALAASMALFRHGTETLRPLGILLADTKFEFGTRDGKLLLIDEVLTPDSSRFWPADDYEVGRDQKSFDKQVLRNHLETLDWDKRPPAPDLDPEVLERVARRYVEICELITGSIPEGVSR